MAGGSLKPMPDLYPITEGIIPIDRVSALFVPGNFRGIRPQVVFFSVEPFKDRRIQFRRDPKIDVRSLDRARAPFSDLIDAMENDQLSRVRHGERELFLTRHLPVFRQTECIPVPTLSLLQVRHLDADMADPAQRNDLPLRFIAYGIPADRKLYSVAVGIENEKRFFDRAGRSILYWPMPFEFPLFSRLRHAG